MSVVEPEPLRLVLGLCAVLVRVTEARLLLAVVYVTLDPLTKALMLLTVPVKTSVVVPDPLMVTPEPEVAAKVPVLTARVRVSEAEALGSLMEMPVTAEAVFSVTD